MNHNHIGSRTELRADSIEANNNKLEMDENPFLVPAPVFSGQNPAERAVF
jgi:hypothetical protein